MKQSYRPLKLLPIALAAATAACGSNGAGPAVDPAEAKAKGEWFQKYASEHPAEATQFSRECQDEVGMGMSPEAALKFVTCVQKKATAPAGK